MKQLTKIRNEIKKSTENKNMSQKQKQMKEVDKRELDALSPTSKKAERFKKKKKIFISYLVFSAFLCQIF